MSDSTRNATAAARPLLVMERTYRASVEELWDLWTTKEGFESWWPPEGSRAEVHAIEARPNGKLHYEMIAETPEMITAIASYFATKLSRIRSSASVERLAR